MQIHQLFPTVVLTKELGRPFSSEEMDVCFNSQYRVDQSTSFESPHNINLTIDHAILKNPALEVINNFLLEQVNHYMFEVMRVSDDVTFHISRSWFVKSSLGNYVRRHNHPNSILSGVLYFKTSKDCGNLMLYDDRSTAFGSMQFGYRSLNPINSSYVSIPPVEGNLVLFPSRVQHEISVNQSYEPRYSLAFDVWVTGTMGCNTDVTKLTL